MLREEPHGSGVRASGVEWSEASLHRTRPFLRQSLMRRIAIRAAIMSLLVPAPQLHAQGRLTALPTERPSLIVFLTVDQMRSDYIDRWATQYTGGLARLGKHGAFFVNGFQDHANTETAPGHSVTMSGRFPRSTGIVSNTTGVLDPQAPLLTSRDAPASPYRF